MAAFHSIPRPKSLFGGFPNHWIFYVRQVPLNPGGLWVFAVSSRRPEYLLFNCVRLDILPHSTISEKAEAVIRQLLKIFLNGVDEDPTFVIHHVDGMAFSPWTWAAEDPELAAAVQHGLIQHGVRKELCQVATCSVEEKQIVEKSYNMFLRRMGKVAPGDTSKCHGCGQSRATFSAPLTKCSDCQKAWYHSQDCQQNHREEHKPTCLANRPASASSPTQSDIGPPVAPAGARTGVSKYNNNAAHPTLEGQALMQSLGLKCLPSRTGLDGLK